ncbi:caffeic acid 3-O-methyltransferase-like [Carex rostrata]
MEFNEIVRPNKADAAADVEAEEIEFLRMNMLGTPILQMTLMTAMELGVLDILVKGCRDAQLTMTADDVAAQITTHNPQAATMLDRMLRLLASFNIVNCTLEKGAENKVVRRYGPARICKTLTKNDYGFAIYLGMHQAFFNALYLLKDSVLEGGIPFKKAHGVAPFEYEVIDQNFGRIFNGAMKAKFTVTVKKMLEWYQGFTGIDILVEVGGGVGATLQMIMSVYTHIKAINFDLPSVISHAPLIQGVKHVCGDMFESVPNGDAILLKHILHDWRDEHCLKILMNCYDAVPSNGKVIVMETILPTNPEVSIRSQNPFIMDLMMMAFFGGKERQLKSTPP